MSYKFGFEKFVFRGVRHSPQAAPLNQAFLGLGETCDVLGAIS